MECVARSSSWKIIWGRRRKKRPYLRIKSWNIRSKITELTPISTQLMSNWELSRLIHLPSRLNWVACRRAQLRWAARVINREGRPCTTRSARRLRWCEITTSINSSTRLKRPSDSGMARWLKDIRLRRPLLQKITSWLRQIINWGVILNPPVSIFRACHCLTHK